MVVGPLAIDPATAIGTFLVFSLIAYFMYRFLNVRSGVLGVKTQS